MTEPSPTTNHSPTPAYVPESAASDPAPEPRARLRDTLRRPSRRTAAATLAGVVLAGGIGAGGFALGRATGSGSGPARGDFPRPPGGFRDFDGHVGGHLGPPPDGSSDEGSADDPTAWYVVPDAATSTNA